MDISDVLFRARKLRALLEDEYHAAENNMQGEFVAPYRKGLKEETDQLQELIRYFETLHQY